MKLNYKWHRSFKSADDRRFNLIDKIHEPGLDENEQRELKFLQTLVCSWLNLNWPKNKDLLNSAGPIDKKLFTA